MASSSSSAVPGLNPAESLASLPYAVRQDAEIQTLCDLYQEQLVELNACHSLLQADQEKLSQMLLPYINAHGELVMENADPTILIFKDGLELRLAEFKEDCKRVQQIEKRLQTKIDAATADYEHTVQDVSNVADARILKRLREQQRLIDIQQSEIDQIRHEKKCLEAETMRLRELTSFGHYSRGNAFQRNNALETERNYPSVHSTFHARIDPNTLPWAQGHLVSPKKGNT